MTNHSCYLKYGIAILAATIKEKVNCPVLVMHGRADEVVPLSHGEKLFAAAPEPKRYLWVDEAGHNDFNRG